MSDTLKLVAFDDADLEVISAHAQDAVLKADDIDYAAKAHRLLLPVNRFAWEAPAARRWLFKRYQRRRSVLHFDRVMAIRSIGIDRKDPQQILSLLSVRFEAAAAAGDPAGIIHLTFSAGAALIAEVECIEARLTDLGAAWATPARPRHRV